MHTVINMVVSEAEMSLFGHRDPADAECWGRNCAPAKREIQSSFTNLTASRRPCSALAKPGMIPTTPVLTASATGCRESESESELPRTLEEEQTPLSTQTPAEPKKWGAASASWGLNNRNS